MSGEGQEEGSEMLDRGGGGLAALAGETKGGAAGRGSEMGRMLSRGALLTALPAAGANNNTYVKVGSTSSNNLSFYNLHLPALWPAKDLNVPQLIVLA